MTDPLPPSKFGAGYTYGGNDRNSQVPPAAPAPPVPLPAAPATYQQPAATYPQPAYATPQPVAPFPYGPPGASQYPGGSASGATAIMAAILALLGGALRAYYSVDLVKGLIYLAKLSGPVGLYVDKSAFIWSVVFAVASLVATAALLIGGIMLLSRKRAGRTLVAIGAFLVIGEAVLTRLAAAAFLQSAGLTGAPLDLGATTAVAVVISIGLPILTLAFALAPSTKRWCR